MFFQEPLISEVHVVNGKSKPKATLSFTGGAGTPFSREPIGKEALATVAVITTATERYYKLILHKPLLIIYFPFYTQS